MPRKGLEWPSGAYPLLTRTFERGRPVTKITKRLCDSIKPTHPGDVVKWDSKLTGFGFRVKPSGSRSFIIQYRNANGRSRRLTIGNYPKLTAEQARSDATQFLAEAVRGGDPAETKRMERQAATVDELCREYLAKAEAGLILRRGKPKKRSTLYTDRGRIDRHIIPLLGNRTVKELTSGDVERFLSDVAAGKTRANVKTKKFGRAIVKGGKGTAARTAGLLGSIFTYAVRQGHRLDNPVQGVERDAGTRREVRLSADQYHALGRALDAAGDAEPWQAVLAIRLIALTGCRRGEIVGLKRSEIDLSGRAFRFSDSKTGKSIRPIGRAATTIIQQALKRSTGGKLVFPSDRKPDRPFVGLPRAWQRIIGDKLDDLTPHGLRHAFSSMGEDLGLSLPTLRALLGHAGRSVTEGYVHKLDSALIAAADKVSDYIADAMAGKAQAGAEIFGLQAVAVR